MGFNKMKVITALILVTVLMFSAPVFSESKQGITYIALGDSIAVGTGATDDIGYTTLLNSHIERVFGEGFYKNLSNDGLTSSEMLAVLQTNSSVQNAISTADIITISIGGNDLLRPFLHGLITPYMHAGSGIDYESMYSDFAAWEQDPSSRPSFNNLLTGLSASYPSLLASFNSNWEEIVSIIRFINPDADIYVNTIFNPFKFNATLFEFADSAIQGLNTPIWNNASEYDYKVIDVYSKFSTFNNSKKPLTGDLSTFPLLVDPSYKGTTPLHPTDFGYKFIFNMHKDLMN